MSEIKVLVVDDDVDITQFMSLCLKSAGYPVEAVHSGEDGCRRARELRPQLLVLDIMMPGMHGFDVCQELRADQTLKDMKILISSAKGYEVDRRAAKRLGADAYLRKPFSTDEFLKAVADLVGKP